MKKLEFFEFKKVVNDYPDAFFYLVGGEPRTGKTYSTLSYAMKNYIKTGEQFAYVRRFREDIKNKYLKHLFFDHIEDGSIQDLTNSKFNSVDYKASKFYLAKNTEENHMLAEEPCGYAFCMSDMKCPKYMSLPKITTIIFDEFISKDGHSPNEWILFANTLSTIIQNRDNVKVIILGNTISKYCMYFQETNCLIDVHQYAGCDVAVICKTGDHDEEV